MKKFISHLGLGLGLALGAGALSVPMILTRPAIAQQIVSATPTGQEVVNNSSVTWKFDNASLIDRASLKLLVDGADVTGQSVIDLGSNTFGYKPSKPFKVGKHSVELQFKNTSGIGYKASWSFNVADIKLEITSVFQNAAQPLRSGDTFRAEIRGTSKAIAQLLLVQDGRTVRTLNPTETANGVYQASFTVDNNDQVNEGILVARLEKSGKIIYRTADSAIALNPFSTTVNSSGVTQTVVTQATNSSNSTQPLTIEVTSPRNNDQMNAAAGFTLTGKTIPGANVTITAQVDPLPPSALQVLGSLVLGSGTSSKPTIIFNQEPVTVKTDGTFDIAVTRLLGVNTGQVYRFSIQATRGNEMQTVNLAVKQN